jgi:hypothetical protein
MGWALNLRDGLATHELAHSLMVSQPSSGDVAAYIPNIQDGIQDSGFYNDVG